MNYTHITREEQYQIYALKNAGHKQQEIAEVLKRSESSISRELSRKSGLRGYRQKQVHSKSVEHQSINARTIYDATWQSAQDRLLEQWSPAPGNRSAGMPPSAQRRCISGSIQTSDSGFLWENLRSQKLRKKRYGKAERDGTIPNRVSINDRSAETTPKEGAHDHIGQRQEILRARRDRQQAEG